MQSPNGVWRKILTIEESRNVAINLINLDNWPQWNSTAQRILSEVRGELNEGNRFDLHRLERKQLIEEMWKVSKIRKGQDPEFTEIRFNWLGQTSNGKKSGNALKSLILEITILCKEEGGIEIAAWWQTSKWSKLFKRKVENSAKQIAKQWLNDLAENGITEMKPIAQKVYEEE
ncbi:MAG: hypothetical protein QF479_00855 [Candidatus Poseidoniaceae archaeon]|jgi:hypothetical protein|nr:hypothetical protein [Candidatus Poseidoniaceae archaeon]